MPIPRFFKDSELDARRRLNRVTRRAGRGRRRRPTATGITTQTQTQRRGLIDRLRRAAASALRRAAARRRRG